MSRKEDHEKNSNAPSKTAGKNRLASETSPYLLQHAGNPVDWYPWGEEAFQKAKRENKPIFLSIGYSSCHWCHVMERESFEDPEIARLMNSNFVSIKVDREERPDVDEIYMKSVVTMTGSGGWPLNVFLTPSLEPFYGGTYFPPTPRYGMPSFSNVLRSISQSWKSDRKRIVESASQMKRSLVEMYDFKRSDSSLVDQTPLGECFETLAGSFDESHGGFGNAPKFPTPSNLFFLLRYHHAMRKKDGGSGLALKMVVKTLDGMMRGGIYDQVGGGFHRYSTDRYWLVPHFEKMLYDNALLVLAYGEAYLLTRDREYPRVIRETLGWVLREMTSGNGGFYSAIDADSTEGEGVYYTWTLDESSQALSAAGFRADEVEGLVKYFSVTRGGNFEEGRNILTAKRIEEIPDVLSDEIIARAKQVLLKTRNTRPAPAIDDKILTGWNGLMISALSRAYSILGVHAYLSAAKRCAEFLFDNLSLKNDQGRMLLRRSFRSESANSEAVLEDYSFLANGLLDLYETDFDLQYLTKAIELAKTMIADYYDEKAGGFFQTPSSASKNLIVRAKDAFDGALPSGNSVAALVCLRLAEFTGDDDYRRKGTDTISAFWEAISSQPTSFTEMMTALQFLLAPPKEIILSGSRAAPDTEAMLKVLRQNYLPNAVIVFADKKAESVTSLVEGRVPAPDSPCKAFVCSNFACKLPSATPDELERSLKD